MKIITVFLLAIVIVSASGCSDELIPESPVVQKSESKEPAEKPPVSVADQIQDAKPVQQSSIPPDGALSLTPKGYALLLSSNSGTEKEEEGLENFLAACRRDPELLRTALRELAKMTKDANRAAAYPVYLAYPTILRGQRPKFGR